MTEADVLFNVCVFVRKKKKNLLASCSGYLDVIERALACGETVLIENLPEKVDPVLEPLLGRNTVKKGRCVLRKGMFHLDQIFSKEKIYT